MRVTITEVLHGNQLEEFIDSRLHLSTREAAHSKGDILSDCHMREQRKILKHHANAALLWTGLSVCRGDGLVSDDYFTGRWILKSADGAKQGGLATATGPKQAANLARLQCKRDIADDRVVIDLDGHLIEFELIRHAAILPEQQALPMLKSTQ